MSWERMFDDTEAAEKKEQEFKPIDKGTYRAIIDNAKLDETKTPARLSINWKLISQGPFANRHVFSNYTMNEKGIPFLKSDLRTLGFPEVTSKSLSKILADLERVEAMIFVKPNPKDDKMFYNVYINEVLDSDQIKKLDNDEVFDPDAEEIPF